MRYLLTICLLFSASAIAQVEYERSAWRHWGDFDGDCQNGRHELLIITSLVPVTFTNDKNCIVATGVWVGPYTGQVFTLATELEIDHIIPLSYAHQHGGESWSPLLKKVFANDPDNILVTKANANSSKGDRGPSEYMPPLVSFRCEYIRRWRFLLAKYEIEPDPADREVIRNYQVFCNF